MTVGERIKQKRTELGWSRLRLSKETGIPVSTLASLEHGDTRASTSTALIAATLGVDPMWLSAGRSRPADFEVPVLQQNTEERRLISLFRTLSSPDSTYVLRIIRGLVASSDH